MNIKNYNFSESKVTAHIVDGNYVWIAFLGSSGSTTLKKVSAHDLSQTYFEITITSDQITALKIDSSYLYGSLESDDYVAFKLNKDNPLAADPIYFDKPGDISETPTDLVISGSDVFILIPGEASGTNAKILKYSITGTLSSTIDLAVSGDIVNYARTMTFDGSNDIWIATYENPCKLVKVNTTSETFESWLIQ